MKSRVLLVLAAGLLLASAPAVAQYDILGEFPALTIAEQIEGGVAPLLTPSVQNSTTFGLIPNEQDFIFEPAELATLKGWKRDRTIGNKWDPAATAEGGWFLLTNLGNTTNADTFQLGTWGQLGPGNLAFVVAYNRYKYESSSVPFGHFKDATDVNGDGTLDHFSRVTDNLYEEGRKTEYNNLDVYLGYGFLIGERSSLGLSVRHVQNDRRPNEDMDSSLEGETDFTYDASGNVTGTRVQNWTYQRGVDIKGDRKADEIAAEFKIWPSDEWSVKVRAQYAKIKIDNINDTLGQSQYEPFPYYYFAYCDNYSGWACQYTDKVYDETGTLTESYLEQEYGKQHADASFDGNEWGISARFNWYPSAGSGWQFDIGYTKGDYNLKNAHAASMNDFSQFLYGLDFGDPYGFLTTYDYNYGHNSSIFVASEDLKSDRWFAGAEYFWQWDQADFAVGLRYYESKAEVTGEGPFEDIYTETYKTLVDLTPTYDEYLYTYDYRGLFSGHGKVDYKWLELPITAVVHVSDRLALRFGAMHVFYKDEYEAAESQTDNYRHYTATFNGEIFSEFLDDMSTATYGSDENYSYDSDYTLYRAGLEYKFNDHVIAELMATESSGDAPTGQEQVALDQIVAGVSIRF